MTTTNPFNLLSRYRTFGSYPVPILWQDEEMKAMIGFRTDLEDWLIAKARIATNVPPDATSYYDWRQDLVELVESIMTKLEDHCSIYLLPSGIMVFAGANFFGLVAPVIEMEEEP